MSKERLSKPSTAVAARILGEVTFENRLVGFRLRVRTGPRPVTLYSFEEVIGFLDDPHPRIDFTRLKAWIDQVMEDRELSEKIGSLIAGDRSERDNAFLIRDLMAERLLQCKALTG